MVWVSWYITSLGGIAADYQSLSESVEDKAQRATRCERQGARGDWLWHEEWMRMLPYAIAIPDPRRDAVDNVESGTRWPGYGGTWGGPGN